MKDIKHRTQKDKKDYIFWHYLAGTWQEKLAGTPVNYYYCYYYYLLIVIVIVIIIIITIVIIMIMASI